MKRSRFLGLIRQSSFFDRAWYVEKYPEARGWRDPAAHYLQKGADAGFDPSSSFSTRAYLWNNPDVAETGLNPLVHYERFGKDEGRVGYDDRDIDAGRDYAVIAHLNHQGCLQNLSSALDRFPEGADRYISYPRDGQVGFDTMIRNAIPTATLIAVDDDGQDLRAFFQALKKIDRRPYTFFCKLHGLEIGELSAVWQEALLRGNASNEARVSQFAQVFRQNSDVVMGGTRELFFHGLSHEAQDQDRLYHLVEQAGVAVDPKERDWGFFAGNSVWLRSELVERMMQFLSTEDLVDEFSSAGVQSGSVVGHLAGLVAHAMGGRIAMASCIMPSEAVSVESENHSAGIKERVSIVATLQRLHAKWIGGQQEDMVAGERPGLGFTRERLAHVAVTGQPGYAIITPTGDRPAAFNRCLQMVMSQSVPPSEWIVVDDGVTPLTSQMVLPEWVTYVRREPTVEDAPHTLAQNILAGIDHIKMDRVLVFEDDDWYSPLYAEYLLPWLESYNLVGLNLIRYYHLRGRAWKQGKPDAHTAFAQSAFRRGHAWEHLKAVCRTGFAEVKNQGVVDRYWWQSFEGTKQLIDEHPCLHVGFKGGFGRPGLASGHERNEVDYIPDPDGTYLELAIGGDRAYYDRWRRAERRSCALYTAVTKDQKLPVIPAADLNAFDFYAFCERPRDNSLWNFLPLDVLDEQYSSLRTSKPKLLPHLYFPEYEWSLWISSDIVLSGELEKVFSWARSSDVQFIHAGIAQDGSIMPSSENGDGGTILLRRHSSRGLMKAMTEDWQERLGARI